MTGVDEERRWRSALRKLGAVYVRQKLQQPAADDVTMSGIIAEVPHPPRRFVDAWYRDLQQRRQRGKRVRSYVLTVSALAIVVAGFLLLALR